jgi:hypothetical protein
MREKTGQDDNSGIMQPGFRLICIHHPGKKTGRIVRNGSVPVGITGEQKNEIHSGPEPPVREEQHDVVGIGLAASPTGIPAGSIHPEPVIPGQAGSLHNWLPDMARDYRSEIPNDRKNCSPQELSGSDGKTAGFPAREKSGSGSR